MPAPLDTRHATETDIAALVTFVNAAYRGDSSRAGWTTEADLLGGQRVDAARIYDAVASPGNIVLLHEEQGELLACVHLQQTGSSCYLGMLTTKPTRQGQGLGRRMIAEAERFAREEWGCTEMHMTVLTVRTELVAWYERGGYVVTGERKPFHYGDERWGIPQRDDLEFYVLRKSLTSMT